MTFFGAGGLQGECQEEENGDNKKRLQCNLPDSFSNTAAKVCRPIIHLSGFIRLIRIGRKRTYANFLLL